MIIRVSELEEQGLRIDDVAALAPGPSPTPRGGSRRVALEVEADGSDVFVRGRLAATVPQTCGRCLESFPRASTAAWTCGWCRARSRATASSWAPTISTWTSTPTIELDLARVVETETTLALADEAAVPARLPGLCPVCGANRNVVSCACAPRPPDPRLAVLRDLGPRQTN